MSACCQVTEKKINLLKKNLIKHKSRYVDQVYDKFNTGQ